MMMNRNSWIAILLSLALFNTETFWAEEVPLKESEKGQVNRSESEPKTIELSLREALFMALGDNLDIRAAQLSPEIQEDDINQAISRFDPTVTANSNGGMSRRQAASDLEGANVSKRDDTNWILGINRRLKTGGLVSSSFQNNRLGTNSRFVSFNPIYTSDLIVSFEQPLLKGRGSEINEGPILIARNNHAISLNDFYLQALEIASSTEKSYWDLVFSIDDLSVKKFALKQAQQLLDDTQERVRVGIQTKKDIVQAEAEVASREEAVILAVQAIHDAEDNLKGFTNLISKESLWNVPIYPHTRPILESVEMDVNQSLEKAFSNRPKYLNAKLDLKNRDIQIVIAKNARYPKLDLSATFGLNGIRGNYANTFDSLISRDFYDWDIGVSLELPLGFRSDTSTFKRRQAEKAQSLIRLKKMEQDILLEVRSAIRRIDSSRKRIQTTEAALRLQQTKLEIERELLNAGRSTTHDVLEFQLDLTRAKSNSLNATIDYQKAKVDLERAQGTLLQSRKFEVLGNSIKNKE